MLDYRIRLENYMDKCNCTEMCSDQSYEVTSHGSPWPHRSDQLAFYKKYIAPYPKIYDTQFDVYAEILANVGNVSNVEILRRVEETKIIRKNFLNINVLFDSYSSIEIDESPLLTVDYLISNVGGTLSL